MRRRLVALLLAPALAAVPGTARAQGVAADGARVPTFARVESADGAPLANAVVTFAGCLPHVGVLGPRDEWHVQTDARGRAHAKLDPALCYVAWAVGPEDERGERAASKPVGWFAGGHVFTLRCEAPSAPRRLRVQGADAWAHVGPLRWFARTSSPGAVVDLALTGDELVLPHAPVAQIEACSADGAPLCLFAAAAPSPVLALPPPQRVPVQVVDGRHAPVAGARVELRVGRLQVWRLDGPGVVVEDRRRVLGTTDAEGKCVVEVPYPGNPLREPGLGELVLFAGAAGRPAVWGGVLNSTLHALGEPVREAVDELRFVCRSAEPLRGSLGRVPPGTAVHLATVCKLPVGDTSYQHDPRTFVVPVAADGTFGFDQVPAELLSLRCTLLPAGPTAAPWPVFPAVAARELPAELTAAPGRDAGALLPEGFADVTLRVVEANGGPARGRVALLTAVPPVRVLSRDATVRCPLDPSGATTLRLAPGRWVVTVCTETGWAARDLTVAPGVQEVALAMEPHALARFELRGEDGQPIAGARVAQRRSSTRGSSDPLQAVLQAMRTQWTEPWSTLRTGSDGRVALPFVPVEGVSISVALQWAGGSTADLPVEPADDWTVVRPR